MAKTLSKAFEEAMYKLYGPIRVDHPDGSIDLYSATSTFSVHFGPQASEPPSDHKGAKRGSPQTSAQKSEIP